MKTDLTTGSPLRGILLFALPIFLGNVFQQGYQMADLAVVSHVLGDDALAALGCTVAVYIVVIGLSSGLSNGFSLVVARCYGGRKADETGRAVTAALWLWAALSLFIMVIGLLFAEPLLRALRTPAEALDMAASYLRIIFWGMPVLLAYNMLAGLLRGVGNSLMPLLFLLAAVTHDEADEAQHRQQRRRPILQPGGIDGREVVAVDLPAHCPSEGFGSVKVFLVGASCGDGFGLGRVGVLADEGCGGNRTESMLAGQLGEFRDGVFEGPVAVDSHHDGGTSSRINLLQPVHGRRCYMPAVDRDGQNCERLIVDV